MHLVMSNLYEALTVKFNMEFFSWQMFRPCQTQFQIIPPRQMLRIKARALRTSLTELKLNRFAEPWLKLDSFLFELKSKLMFKYGKFDSKHWHATYDGWEIWLWSATTKVQHRKGINTTGFIEWQKNLNEKSLAWAWKWGTDQKLINTIGSWSNHYRG